MAQSQLEDLPEVKRLCNPDTLKRVLASGRALKDWQILSLPPQLLIRDNLFRCLVGRGEVKGAMKLRAPR
jgi:hypothetical protein